MAIVLIDPATTIFAGSFLFVFAVVFGLLSISNVLKHVYVNMIIAAVFGVFAASNEDFASTLQEYIPLAAGLLIVLFFIVFIKRAFEGGEKKSRDMLPIAVAIAFLLIVLGVFGDAVASLVPGVAPDTVLWTVGIVAVLLLFYAAYTHKPT